MSHQDSGGEFGMALLAIVGAGLIWLAIHVGGIVMGWDRSPPPRNSAYPHTSNRGVFD